MKNDLKRTLMSALLMAGLSLLPAGRVAGQALTVLHTFSEGGDGYNPQAPLVLSSNTLYGTTLYGGSGGGYGTVFAVNTDGTAFTTLHAFSPGGGQPTELILSGNTLYGTAQIDDTVFKIKTDGTGFTNIFHTFDGSSPRKLVLSGNTLYGIAVAGGTWNNGTVFAVDTDGLHFRNLHSFGPTIGKYYETNSDGIFPTGLVLSGSTLYGVTEYGGNSGEGTIFKLNTDGTGFTNLHHFAFDPENVPNSDGFNPSAGLILSGDTLYGTAVNGGSEGNGTVFAINTNGADYMTLHSFASNRDGTYPAAKLLLSSNTLYGVTWFGGDSDVGTVFALNTDGSNFTVVQSLTGSIGNDSAGLILSGNTFYGASAGVYSLSMAPQLTLGNSGANLLLSWPTNQAGFDYTGFSLQSTTDLVSGAWTDVPTPPVPVNGQNTVTDPLSGTQRFYRLIK